MDHNAPYLPPTIFHNQFNLSSISLEARVTHVIPMQESWITRPQEKWKSVVMEKKKLFKIIGAWFAENWCTLNIVHACLKKLEC